MNEQMSSIHSIEWSHPLTVEVVQADYSVIPNESGVYVFTTRDTAIRADTGVLYVGKAAQLRRRLRAYLKSPFDILLLSPTKRDGTLSRSLRHTGKNLLLMKIQQGARYSATKSSGLWVRWHVCQEPAAIEHELIVTLEPAFNTSSNPRVRKS